MNTTIEKYAAGLALANLVFLKTHFIEIREAALKNGTPVKQEQINYFKALLGSDDEKAIEDLINKYFITYNEQTYNTIERMIQEGIYQLQN